MFYAKEKELRLRMESGEVIDSARNAKKRKKRDNKDGRRKRHKREPSDVDRPENMNMPVVADSDLEESHHLSDGGEHDSDEVMGDVSSSVDDSDADSLSLSVTSHPSAGENEADDGTCELAESGGISDGHGTGLDSS